jgi:sulfite exporter TauE/SafE
MMFNDPAILLSAFLLGFLGSAHCLGMCGGLSSALGLNTQQSSTTSNFPTLLLAYNIGRIFSYCIAGLIVGAAGFWLSQQLATFTLLRYLAGGMLILMGLYIAQWFNGIAFTEKLGSKLWPFIQPLGKRFMPVKSIRDAICIGMVWGWLPCGLVYSALIWASLEASVSGAMLIMLFFGIGTLPAMLATGYFAQELGKFIKQRWFRSSAGLMMISFGIHSLPIVQLSIQRVFHSF